MLICVLLFLICFYAFIFDALFYFSSKTHGKNILLSPDIFYFHSMRTVSIFLFVFHCHKFSKSLSGIFPVRLFVDYDVDFDPYVFERSAI